MARIKDLANCPMFQGFEPVELARLVTISSRQELTGGEFLFGEGEVSSTMYVVSDGSLDVFAPQIDPENPILHVNRGEVLCELALLGETKHLVTAKVASQKATLIGFEHGIFMQFLQKHPELGAKLIGTITPTVSNKVSALAGP